MSNDYNPKRSRTLQAAHGSIAGALGGAISGAVSRTLAKAQGQRQPPPARAPGEDVAAAPMFAAPPPNAGVGLAQNMMRGAPAVLNPEASAPSVSSESISNATAQTGVSSRYLEALDGHEGRGRPSTSSAVGFGQFVQGTWLDMMKKNAAKYGLDVSGMSRQNILDLRLNDRWSTLMTALLAQQNDAALRSSLGRRVSDGEVYLAHVFGARDAGALIRAAARDTGTRAGGRAAYHFVNRDSVHANRSIFFDGGRARSAREVVARLTTNFDNVAFRSNLDEALAAGQQSGGLG